MSGGYRGALFGVFTVTLIPTMKNSSNFLAQQLVNGRDEARARYRWICLFGSDSFR